MNESSKRKSAALRDQEWLAKAVATHGGKYDYSRVQYENRHKLVEIVCTEHGAFMQAMHSHLRGTGCPRCAGLAPVGVDEFVEAAQKAHGGRYSYDAASYAGWGKPVLITCPEHGGFSQVARDHALRTAGCPRCAYEKAGESRRSDEVLVGLGLEFCEPRFAGMSRPLGVVCPDHGKYVVGKAGDVAYNGVRCPRCAHTVSRWEIEVGSFLTSMGVVAERTRAVIAPKEIDLYSAGHRVGVECHGVRFHSTAFQKSAVSHLNKLRMAQSAGIRLLQVFDDEWKYRRSAVENLLRSAFGKAARTFARECSVVATSSSVVAEFLDETHIQGAAKGSVVFALHKDGETQAVMVFSKVTSERGATDAGWELVRYASRGTVVGGASRLFSAFVKAHSPERVVSYSDRRLFSGGMYEKLGFSKIHDTRPSYTVLVGDRRMHKAGFKKALLAKKLGAEAVDGKTEREVCEAQGWFRVYDCGLTKWEWKR